MAGQRTMAIMELSSLLEQMKQIEAQEASLLSVASDRQAQVLMPLAHTCSYAEIERYAHVKPCANKMPRVRQLVCKL
jgi:hypothetical protein